MKKIQLIAFALTLIGLLQNLNAQEFVDKWEASYAATGNIEVIKTLSDDQNNVYILANQINSGTSEVVLMKYDQEGNRDWLRSYDYNSTSEDYGVDMVNDDSDNIYILISVNPDNAQNFSDNGYAIRKYSSGGTLTNSYQSVGGFFGNIPSIISYSSDDKIFITSSRYASANMGLNLTLGRLTNSLTFERQETYDSSEDDIPYALDFSSTKANVYFTKGTNTMSLASIPKDFGVSDDFTIGFSLQDGNGGRADHDISATPFESLILKEDITILKYATGTKLMYQKKAGNDFYITFRSFNSTYKIEDLYTHVSNGTYPFNHISLTVTGSKTANGEEQMFVLYLDNTATSGDVIPQWATEYEKSLNENHDGIISRGLVATKNESYGRLVQRNSAVSRTYAGFATFENSNTQEVEYHSQSADFETTHLELLSNGQVYVGTSGSTLELYALCNPPDVTGLGDNQLVENGETVNLSINSQGSNSIEWSTGETGETQISVTGVSETKVISVTVTDDSGCSTYEEVEIVFVAPPPAIPQWLQPTISVSDGVNTEIVLNWRNDDVSATSHEVIPYNVSAGLQVSGVSTSNTTALYNVGVDRYQFTIKSANNDGNQSSPSSILDLLECGSYDMSYLESKISSQVLDGDVIVAESDEVIFDFRSLGTDSRYFIEWTLPFGWEMKEYINDGAEIRVTPTPGASNGEITARFVNPCTGVATSTISRDVVVSNDTYVKWQGTAWSNTGNDTWSGSSDNRWMIRDLSLPAGTYVAADFVVDQEAEITVQDGATLEITGELFNYGNIIVESGGSLITYGSQNLDSEYITFKRNTRYADGKYSFVGSPVSQNGSIDGSDLGTDVYRYDESQAYGSNGSARWIDATSDQLVKGVGYTQANQQEIIFLGHPNVGTVNVSGTYTGTYNDGTNEATEGWNLVANPYSTAINVGLFLAENTNVEGAVYIWDDNGSNSQQGTNNDYIVANGTTTTNTTPAGGKTRYNQHIGSAQGFFVKLKDDGDTQISFTEAMRVSGSNADGNFFRESPLPLIRVNLQNKDGLFKQAVVGMAEAALENELNRTYDAPAFNAASGTGIYSMKAGRTLALNGVPQDWEIVQLQVNIEKDGMYEVDLESEHWDQEVFLIDTHTGESINLTSQSYSFSATAGIHIDRFILASSPSNVLGLEESNVLVYAHKSILHILQKTDDLREYQLFNMNGKKLLSTSVQSRGEVNLSAYAKGIYLVFDGQKTHKIILD